MLLCAYKDWDQQIITFFPSIPFIFFDHIGPMGSTKSPIRMTTSLVCDVTLPAGVDKTDNLPIGITETLHMPQIIMVFTSFDAYPPLGKKRVKWSREIADAVFRYPYFHENT